MNNIITTTNNNEIDQHVWSALKNSLYTGAKDESIKMVLDYCKAAKLDPLQKPVHIVPMSVKNSLTGKYEYKDVVMAGVGLYRIQAARSQQYAGVSEPEFGEDIITDIGGVKITYPKWCKVTVKKMINNTIVEFTAKEYWIENYATAGKDSLAPNAMWRKRPYAQLAKCAEAQALRKAFPEIVSQHPTAEEMEGKVLNEFGAEFVNTQVHQVITKDITPKTDKLSAKLDNIILTPASDDKKTELLTLVEQYHVPQELLTKWCQKANVESLNDLGEEQINKCINYIVNTNFQKHEVDK